MAHLIIATDGMPEGVNDLFRQIDRKGYTKGAIRMRPIQMWDIQVPKEDLERIKKDLGHVKGMAFAEHEYKEKTLGWKMKYAISPFKHGLFKSIPYWIFKLFGWPLGLKPCEPADPNIKNDNPVVARMTNVYCIAEVEDNAWISGVNKGKGETNKDVEKEYL